MGSIFFGNQCLAFLFFSQHIASQRSQKGVRHFLILPHRKAKRAHESKNYNLSLYGVHNGQIYMLLTQGHQAVLAMNEEEEKLLITVTN